MSGKCAVETCNNQTDFFESVDCGDKCIFHCDKSDETKWGNPESKDVKRFWRAIREQIKDDLQNKSDEHLFDKYIFPVSYHGIELISFEKHSKFYWCIFAYKCIFSNLVFKDEVIFAVPRLYDDLLFSRVNFEKSAIFVSPVLLRATNNNEQNKNKQYQLGFINKTIFESDVIIDNPCNIENIVFNECSISSAQLFLSKAKDCEQLSMIKLERVDIKGRFSFNKSDIDKVLLSDCTFEKDSIVDFENLTCNEFVLDKFKNNSNNFKLSNITVNTEFSTNGSRLGKLEFNGVTYNDNCKIKLHNTSLVESSLTNVKWGEINEDRFDIDRQMARQLKAINDAQGETVIANEFYALEMNLRSKELKWQWGDIGEKIVQNIHGLVSNHSNDWALPTIWFFAFGLMFSSLAIPYDLNILFGLVSVLAVMFGIVYADKLSIKRHYAFAMIFFIWNFIFFVATYPDLSYLVAFINPLGHRESHFLLEHISLFWLYIGRLIEVFIGYQIITAIRKNTRRK